MMVRYAFPVGVAVLLSGCGVVYTSPDVSAIAPDSAEAAETGFAVDVIRMTPDSVIAANVGPSAPRLPAAFDTTTVARGFGAPPPRVDTGAAEALATPARATTGAAPARPLPDIGSAPYRIGVGDVIALGAPAGRETFSVQDNGIISVPSVGQVDVGGLTVEEARDRVLRAFVTASVDPTFSFEIVEFNAQSVIVTGAVAESASIPIRLEPLTLAEALQSAGGVAFEDLGNAVVEITRGSETYRVPASEIYRGGGDAILVDGDIVFVDVGLTEAARQRAFDEQIELRRLEAESARIRADAMRVASDNARFSRDRFDAVQDTFLRRQSLGAEDAGFAYLTGEVNNPLRYPLPYERRASLADVLHDDRGIPLSTGDYGAIYVLRGSDEDLSRIIAYHLDGENAAAMVLSTRFVIRPNDVVFVAEQPVTTWNRVISQILPGNAVGAGNALGNAVNN